MKKTLIHSLVSVSYADKTQDVKNEAVTSMIDRMSTIEEKAATFYRFFMKGTTPKVDFAQQLAMELETKFRNKGEELRELLPAYLVSAIDYVVGADI